jgi:hypothetical protein
MTWRSWGVYYYWSFQTAIWCWGVWNCWRSTTSLRDRVPGVLTIPGPLPAFGTPTPWVLLQYFDANLFSSQSTCLHLTPSASLFNSYWRDAADRPGTCLSGSSLRISVAYWLFSESLIKLWSLQQTMIVNVDFIPLHLRAAHRTSKRLTIIPKVCSTVMRQLKKRVEGVFCTGESPATIRGQYSAAVSIGFIAGTHAQWGNPTSQSEICNSLCKDVAWYAVLSCVDLAGIVDTKSTL